MARVAWLIPRLVDGSGGIRTMLRHAKGLEEAGHQCHLHIEGVGDRARTQARIRALFGLSFERVSHGWDAVAPADILVATIWYSAAIARDLPMTGRRIYFVQDYEAWFNPMGDAYLLAENSYRLGLIPVTIGRWLAHELSERFATPAFHFDFGADPTVYRRLQGTERELAVCFLHQPEKPRRCARLGIDALGILKHCLPNVSIHLYGSSERGRVWFEHQSHGLLGIQDCNALYNRCALGLSLSPSNPSRVPFEMMAAGLPVVELWRPTTLHDFPPQAVSLAHPTPESIAEAMLRLLEDPGRRERMGQAGIEHMSGHSGDEEVRQFVSIVERILAGAVPASAPDEPRLYTSPPIMAGARTQTLPRAIRARLDEPPNALVNRLPPLLRTLIGSGARVARRVLDNR